MVTVTDVPTLIAESCRWREELTLENQGAVILYYGDTENVSTTGTRTGRLLGAGNWIKFTRTLDPNDVVKHVWGICVGGATTTIKVVED